MFLSAFAVTIYEYAAIAQQVERILGKDEVPSSNLGSSSIETRCPARDSGFLLFLEVISIGKKD